MVLCQSPVCAPCDESVVPFYRANQEAIRKNSVVPIYCTYREAIEELKKAQTFREIYELIKENYVLGGDQTVSSIKA